MKCLTTKATTRLHIIMTWLKLARTCSFVLIVVVQSTRVGLAHHPNTSSTLNCCCCWLQLSRAL
jgi:hypothetical protein